MREASSRAVGGKRGIDLGGEVILGRIVGNTTKDFATEPIGARGKQIICMPQQREANRTSAPM